MFGKRGFKHLGLSLLLGGAFACSSSEATNPRTGISFDPAGFDGFESKTIPLLATDCTYSSGNITITVGANETGYIFRRASDSAIVANANFGASECTVAVGKTITFTGASGSDQKVIIDFYSGIFTAALGTAQGIAIDLGGDSGDSVEVRTTTGNDLVTLGTNTNNSKTYLTLSAVGTTPAKTTPDITITGAKAILVSTGAGNDNINAQGGAAVGQSGQTVVGPVDGNISLTFYGGDGNDTIVSGAASVNPAYNALYGGAGDDFFPQQSALAADHIYGGDGIDTVDYGSRSSAIRATLGGSTAAKAATGSIGCVSKATLADNDYFEIPWDGTHSQRFAYKKTADAIQTGSITCKAKAGITNNQYFSITDGTKTVTYEYDKAGDGSVIATHGGTLIDISGDATNIEVCARTFTAINTAQGNNTIDISPSWADPNNPGATVTLTTDAASWGKALVNNTGAGLASVTAFTGGFSELQANIDANAIIIDISGVSSAPAVCGLTYTAISDAYDADDFPVTATDPEGTTYLALRNDVGGVDGNQTITKSGSFAVSNMAGGAAAIAIDDGDIAGPERDDLNAEIENVVGSSAGDTIDGSASDIVHVFLGMDGDDTLIGGPGHANYLYGGKNNDTLIGGGVADFLYGGDNDDVLQGGLGNDTINGGGNNCVGTAATTAAPIMPFPIPVCTSGAVTAGTAATSDTVDYSDRSNAVRVDLTQINTTTCTAPNYMGDISGTECDIIVGTTSPAAASVKNIKGGAGNDVLKGDARDNRIVGGPGNDQISGGLGNDALYGGAGNDTIYGNDGTNALIATTLSDNDFISGGTGSNTLKGDDGLDTIDASMGSDAVFCGKGDGDILLSSGNETSNDGLCEL